MTDTEAKTKAQLGAPPSARRGSAIASLTKVAEKPADNMKAEKLKDLSFKVDDSFHANFKLAAIQARKSMKEVLEEAFELWLEKHQK